MEECCICLSVCRNNIFPCRHVMCKVCICKWCEKSVFCPICKEVVVSPCDVSDLERHWKVCVQTNPGVALGMTLVNGRDGVTVRSVRKNSLASKRGLKEGHVLTHINDLPVKIHKNATDIVHSARKHSLPLHFSTLEKEGKRYDESSKSTFQRCIECLFSCADTKREGELLNE